MGINMHSSSCYLESWESMNSSKNRLSVEEDQGKMKTLAFKIEISKGKSPKKDEDFEDENISLTINRFAKFMKSKGNGKFWSEKKENPTSLFNYKCYGDERGHLKVECPKNKKGKEKNEKKSHKKKKAYIT